jgi:hypothetical protein
MKAMILCVFLVSCAEAGKKVPAPRPPSAGVWRAGVAGQAAATRIYRSSGLALVCLRYSSTGEAVVHLEIGRSSGPRRALHGFGTQCERMLDVREGDEARLVFDGAITGELRGELSTEDINP